MRALILCACGHSELIHDRSTRICCETSCPCMVFRRASSSASGCPRGHTTGVREIGPGSYFCSVCGRRWTG